MPGLWDRIMLIFKSKAYAAVDRAEKPAETLDYSYEQQVQLLQNVRRGVADVVTAKKQLEIQANRLRDSVVKLETQARQALSLGREDLARVALQRKSAVQQQLRDLDAQVAVLEERQQKLVADQQALQARVEAFRSEKEVMKAQYRAAEAQVQIKESMTGIGDQLAETTLAIQRAKDKTLQMEARAAALDELVSTGALEDVVGGPEAQLDKELAALSSDAQVELELQQLKGELEPGDPRKQLEPADAPKDTPAAS
jgi:phage shock protein A